MKSAPRGKTAAVPFGTWPYIKADVPPDSLRRLVLFPATEDTGPDVVYVQVRDVRDIPLGLFLRRRDVARLLFAGQRERLAFHRRATYIAESVALAARAEAAA